MVGGWWEEKGAEALLCLPQCLSDGVTNCQTTLAPMIISQLNFIVFLWDTSFPVCPVSTTCFWAHYAWDLSSLTSVEPIPLLWKSENEVTQSCPTLWDPMDSSLPGSSIHRIFQARVVEWAAISFSRGSSQSRDRTWVSCIADRHFTAWPLGKPCFGGGGGGLSHWTAREVPPNTLDCLPSPLTVIYIICLNPGRI